MDAAAADNHISFSISLLMKCIRNCEMCDTNRSRRSKWWYYKSDTRQYFFSSFFRHFLFVLEYWLKRATGLAKWRTTVSSQLRKKKHKKRKEKSKSSQCIKFHLLTLSFTSYYGKRRFKYKLTLLHIQTVQ